jgi:hypothetical protein
LLDRIHNSLVDVIGKRNVMLQQFHEGYAAYQRHTPELLGVSRSILDYLRELAKK